MINLPTPSAAGEVYPLDEEQVGAAFHEKQIHQPCWSQVAGDGSGRDRKTDQGLVPGGLPLGWGLSLFLSWSHYILRDNPFMPETSFILYSLSYPERPLFLFILFLFWLIIAKSVKNSHKIYVT